MTDKQIWRAYTDASCYPNPGPAGAAAVIDTGKTPHKILHRGHYGTTINRAELTGIYLAVAYFAEHDDGERSYLIYSDSEWSVKALRHRLWQKVDGYPVNKNLDIIEAIFTASEPIRDRLNISHIPRLSHVHNRKADAVSRDVRLIYTEKAKRKEADGKREG